MSTTVPQIAGNKSGKQERTSRENDCKLWRDSVKQEKQASEACVQAETKKEPAKKPSGIIYNRGNSCSRP